MPCPLCQSEELKFLSHTQVPKELFHCQACDLIFKSPELYQNWNEQAARYDQHSNHIDNPGYVEFFEQLLKPLRLYLHAGKRALDWGSGPGEQPVLSQLLKREGLQVEIYDPIYQKQMPAGPFDLITSTEVIEHFQKPRESFEQILGFLSQKGIFAGLTSFHQGREGFSTWWYVKDPTHVVFYSYKTFDWIAENWKLEILYIKSPVFIFKKK